jgi:hypothetical protein
MATSQQFAITVAGTALLASVQLLGFVNVPPSPASEPFRDFDLVPTSVANQVAKTRPSQETAVQSNKTLLLSQATGSRMRYVPPVTRNPRRSQGSGSRGCDESLPGDLVTLLIPSKDYTAQTTLGHPTFFWHLSQAVSVPMKFSLVEPGVAQPLFVKQIDSPQAGIVQLELPKDRPQLVNGKIYSWSVSLVCNAKRPSANPYFYSWIERVPLPPALEEQLSAKAGNSSGLMGIPATVSSLAIRDRAALYAQAGLWYDALAVIATQSPNSRTSLSEDFLTLLDQVGLSGVTKQTRQSLAKR